MDHRSVVTIFLLMDLTLWLYNVDWLHLPRQEVGCRIGQSVEVNLYCNGRMSVARHQVAV